MSEFQKYRPIDWMLIFGRALTALAFLSGASVFISWIVGVLTWSGRFAWLGFVLVLLTITLASVADFVTPKQDRR